MSEHSLCGPSSLARRLACPGSLRMERDLADTESDASALGTSLHAAVSAALNGDERPLKALDSEEEGAAGYCIGFAEQLEKDNKTFNKLVEHKTDLTHIHAEIGFGTLDLALVQAFNRAILVDWKFLYQDVPPAWKNLQMRAYASGLAEAFQLREVETYTVQPHRNIVTRHVYSAADLEKSDAELRAGIEKCLALDAPLVAGTHCKYCRAKVGCPALAGRAKELPIKTDASVLSVADMASYLDLFDSVEAWIAAVKQRAYAILAEGGEIPGWALKPGRGSRAWNADAETGLRALAQMLKKDSSCIFTVPELLSPAQIEKAFGKSKAVSGALEPLIEKLPGRLRLEKETEDATG